MAPDRKLPPDFGDRLRLARAKLNASRKALSELMAAEGASESTIKKYESGLPPGSLIARPFIARLAEVTGISEDYFWGEDGAWSSHAPSRELDVAELVVTSLDRIADIQQKILDRLDALAERQGMLTAAERETLSEVAAALNRLGRDVGRGQPLQRSGRRSPVEASGPAA